MALECLTLCTLLAFLGWVKIPDIETVHISIIWLNLIGFGYDLSVIKDGLKCWRMGFMFCGKHLLLLTRIRVSGLGPMGPLVTLVLNGKSQMSTRLLHFG